MNGVVGQTVSVPSVVTGVPVKGLLGGHAVDNVKIAVSGKTVTISVDVDEGLANKLAAVAPVLNMVLSIV